MGNMPDRMEPSPSALRSVVDSLPQSILRKDLEGRFTFANSTFCRTLGIELAHILGRTDFDFYPADLAQKYQADDRRVIESGQRHEAVEMHQDARGKTYVQVVKTPVWDEAGQAIGIQGIFWDVTDREISEERLRFERDLLGKVLDTYPDAIYFKDRQSRFMKVSRYLAMRLGVSDPADALGKTDADFHTPEYASAALADEQRILQTGVGIIAKLECEGHGGEKRWVITSKLPLRDQAGEIVGTFGISRDVTDLKRIEAALADARDVALGSLKLKAEFLANMSHEIRTPLNAIIGMSGLLTGTPLDPEQRDFASTIRTSADLLLGIVNDILDFSKIEAGKLSIDRIDFDLAEVIEETADLLAEKAQGKGIELLTWVPPHVPRRLVGDPGRIRQVLANLVSNAVKFTARGEVVVQARLVRETADHATIRLQVRDTGIGIPAEAQLGLFTAFTQVDGTTTRRYGGTGLGLAISKQLVTLMGGEIGLESSPGNGSTFWVTLTLPRQPGAVEAAEPSDVDLSGLRVLIVDDNETNRGILHRQVSSWRMRYGACANGSEALSALETAAMEGDPYRVVILDMQMPDMDGMSVARAIRSDPKLGATRIVILTSLAYHADEAKARSLGISAYLTKPIKQSRLFDSLATVMSAPDPVPASQLSAAVTVTPFEAPASANVLPVHSTRILIAEDNAVNQKVALRQLAKLGYAADAVSSGTEALLALERLPYDLVLMDCQMPEMDGYEATRRIRAREQANPDRPRHRIIAITAHTLDGDRERCLDAGMDDYLSKPIRFEDLSRMMRRWAETR